MRFSKPQPKDPNDLQISELLLCPTNLWLKGRMQKCSPAAAPRGALRLGRFHQSALAQKHRLTRSTVCQSLEILKIP